MVLDAILGPPGDVEKAIGTAVTGAADIPADAVNETAHQLGMTEGKNTGAFGSFFDAAGTAGTGAVDSFIADPGNALMGVDAPNMGIFEEGHAGSRAAFIGSLGLGGQGGILTNGLLGQPVEEAPHNGGGNDEQEQSENQPDSGGSGLALAAMVLGAIAALIAIITAITN